MLVTGSSRQSLEWNAANGDGWMNYPRNLYEQKMAISEWRDLIDQSSNNYSKPFMQPLYVVLEKDDFKPEAIPLGFRIGVNYLLEYFHQIQDVGVNHVAVNLRFNSNNMDQTLETLANNILPHFHEENEERIKTHDLTDQKNVY